MTGKAGDVCFESVGTAGPAPILARRVANK
jgi:hypothetical protein